MKAAQTYFFLHIVLTVLVPVNTLGPFSTLFDFIASMWQNFNDPKETCNSEWISFNVTGLQVDLERKLFGQHIAAPIILRAVNAFMSNDILRKPLVLSLHGPPGTGKNFASQLIAENIYRKGLDSSFVHVFNSLLHFPHPSLLETYKTQLQQWIKGNVTNCANSMFIFDEMDKMHRGLFDSIKPNLISYHFNGVSYRRVIFIFLSNDGANEITQRALDFWKEGRAREEMELRDLKTLLSVSAFNSNSGFWQSSLIHRGMIDFFIPFLPLEHRHVIQCAMAEMRAKGLQQNLKVALKVAEDLQCFPEFDRLLYTKGCKTIGQRLHLYYKEEL